MKKCIIIISSVLVVATLAFGAFCAIAADPATDSDPLVTKSYVEQVVVPSIYNYIDSKTQSASSDSFKVVAVGTGKKLVCEAGCELILRMGSATIIGSVRGGLADVTSGADLANGAVVPANHHLIVPVSDGRGIVINAPNDALVMVKGAYQIQ